MRWILTPWRCHLQSSDRVYQINPQRLLVEQFILANLLVAEDIKALNLA